MDVLAAADALEEELRAQGSPERAAGEKRYLKSSLEFHGTTVWQIERAVRAFTVEQPVADHDALIALVTELWRKPIHERRMAAVMLVERYRPLLGAGDLPLLERFIRESKTWAYVDSLATDVLGPLCAGSAPAGEVLDRWAADGDFWVRRAALLSQLPAIRQGAPLDRFLRYADAMLEEREFFVRKAIGWVLREAGKRRPAAVAEWLAPRTHRASGVTMREALKYLPAKHAEWLMAASVSGAQRVSAPARYESPMAAPRRSGQPSSRGGWRDVRRRGGLDGVDVGRPRGRGT